MAKALQADELAGVMAELGIDSWEQVYGRVRDQEERVFLSTPVGVRMHVARSLAKFIHRSRTLVHFDEWGIWDDIPGMHRRLRQSAGVDLEVWECASELIFEDEADYLTSVLYMVVSFSWDAYVIDADRQVGVYICHDDWFAPVGSAEFLAAFAEEFDHLPRFLGWQVEGE